MHYSVYFFALDADDVAKQFREQAPQIADKVVELIAAQRDASDTELAHSREFAQNICLGKFSQDEPEEEINVLCWMCEVVGEKIDIPAFNMFRSVDYLEDVGVWPLFQQEKPPFPVPTCAEGLPEVGYMSRSAIKRHVASEFAELPECSDPGAEDARDDLLGILESLSEDNLDLIAIFTQN